ncbi:OLC1v1019412C1 [Oldenlandia corymbosa var. corymbosa]|uniref:OLC1v1019412C1 n=1 Tax=Oldenlandia corymbosa var. corymbosa TaxID=529605 RepID=A0AAV1EDU8_OLDCO|nr:OLC1v1019412C1 [Oldenlandia corymbosa var. corymbosa]
MSLQTRLQVVACHYTGQQVLEVHHLRNSEQEIVYEDLNRIVTDRNKETFRLLNCMGGVFSEKCDLTGKLQLRNPVTKHTFPLPQVPDGDGRGFRVLTVGTDLHWRALEAEELGVTFKTLSAVALNADDTVKPFSWKQKLALADLEKGTDLHLWILEDYKNSEKWSGLKILRPSTLFGDFPPEFKNLRPLSSEDHRLWFCRADHSLLVYNIKTRQEKTRLVPPAGTCRYIYIPILSNLNGALFPPPEEEKQLRIEDGARNHVFSCFTDHLFYLCGGLVMVMFHLPKNDSYKIVCSEFGGRFRVLTVGNDLQWRSPDNGVCSFYNFREKRTKCVPINDLYFLIRHFNNAAKDCFYEVICLEVETESLLHPKFPRTFSQAIEPLSLESSEVGIGWFRQGNGSAASVDTGRLQERGMVGNEDATSFDVVLRFSADGHVIGYNIHTRQEKNIRVIPAGKYSLSAYVPTLSNFNGSLNPPQEKKMWRKWMKENKFVHLYWQKSSNLEYDEYRYPNHQNRETFMFPKRVFRPRKTPRNSKSRYTLPLPLRLMIKDVGDGRLTYGAE